MHAIRILTFKAFARFLRNKTAVALTFFVPMALITLFGYVFGLNRKDSGPSGIRLAVVNESGNPALQKLVDALEAEPSFRVVTTFTQPDKTTRPLTSADLRPLIENNAFRYAILIPDTTGEGSTFGLKLKLLSNPQNDIEAQTVNGLLQKTIFSRVPELLTHSLQQRARAALGAERMNRLHDALADAYATALDFDRDAIRQAMNERDWGLSRLTSAGRSNGQSSGGADDVFSRLVSIENEQVVGKNVKSPAATRVVGGWAIMFLMFALNGAATSLFEEKKSGMFQRLLAAPVTRADILWSRFLFGVVLGLVQLVTIFAMGSLLYGIDVFGHLGNLVVVSLASAAACTALGMFIASVSSSEEAAMGLATFLVLGMSACGGAWFPISFMPPFMQEAAKFTITYWAMDGFAQVLWAGKSFAQILPTVGVLLGITAVVMGIAVWRFNRGRIFE